MKRFNDWLARYSGVVTFLQFLTIPFLVSGTYVANLYLDTKYSTKTEAAEYTRKADAQFTEINVKLSSILNNQTAFTEQVKMINQFLTSQDSKITRIDDRVLFLERKVGNR
ncbi:MAG: hypothetical protein WC390_06660 [Sulfurimonas sp.]|jgi:hypothetical protein